VLELVLVLVFDSLDRWQVRSPLTLRSALTLLYALLTNNGQNRERETTMRTSTIGEVETQGAPDHTVPYGTALLRWGCSRHFVPGYDQTVTPGLSRHTAPEKRLKFIW
jgi:hypothetical protein